MEELVDEVVDVAVHTPATHFPTEHVVPSIAAGFEHAPAAQVPATWHSSNGVQVMGVPAHAPASHPSSNVHSSPSSQLVPSLAAGLEHPIKGSQTPATWH